LTIPHESFTFPPYKPSSNQIRTLLKPQSLEYLTSLTLPRNTDEDTIETRFPTEDVVTVTRLTRGLDSFKRPLILNKTVIIQLDDYLRAYPPKNLVKGLLR